jgi:hypothetical protein
MTDFAFPADLAHAVMERWGALASKHGDPPPLPAAGDLHRILNSAFFASLEREEGRPLRFVLCCAPDGADVRDGLGEIVPMVPLQVARQLSVASIRSLAPAVSPDNAALLVRFPREEGRSHPCDITGILHVGEHVARARSGRSFYYRPAPYALMVEVVDAGELHVYQAGARLVSIKAGHLQNLMAYSALDFLPVSPILTTGEQALRARIVAPRHESPRETSDFEWTALLNTILCIVNAVRARGHGGTVLLVAPGSERSLPVRTKFGVAPGESVLGERFIEFLNTRHALTEARLNRDATPGLMSPAEALAHLQNAAFAAEEALVDAAEVVAGLAAVDGAVVLTSDLRAIGFGAEIVLDATEPVIAHEVTGHLQAPESWPAVDSESFGMRHRSALRGVGVAERMVAFVVSQDGQVSLFWKQDDRVLLRRDVNTANPNMIGA